MKTNDASQLSLPLVAALSAIPIILSVGISYGVGTARLDDIKARVSDVEIKQQEIAHISERLARVETKIDFLVDMKKAKSEGMAANP